MGRGQKHIWTPEQSARVGTLPDAEIAKELGIAKHVVTYRRVSLGRSAALTGASTAVELDENLLVKIDELAPLLAAKFRAQGLPVRTIERWQVVEFAINQMHAAAKKDATRVQYLQPVKATGDSAI